MQKPEITGLRNLSKLKKLVICACAEFKNGRIQIIPRENKSIRIEFHLNTRIVSVDLKKVVQGEKVYKGSAYQIRPKSKSIFTSICIYITFLAIVSPFSC